MREASSVYGGESSAQEMPSECGREDNWQAVNGLRERPDMASITANGSTKQSDANTLGKGQVGFKHPARVQNWVQGANKVSHASISGRSSRHTILTLPLAACKLAAMNHQGSRSI